MNSNLKIQCPICSSANIDKKEIKIKYGEIILQSLEHYSLFICHKCLSEFAWPREKMNYENVSTELKGYQSFINKEAFEGQLHHVVNGTSHWKDSPLIYHILSLLNFRGEFLDFAAGSGYMSELARRLGYSVHALEINSDFRKFIKEMVPDAIVYSSLDELLQSGNKFSVINAMHILEHLDDPIEVLTKLHSTLSHPGIIIVAVPNLDRAYYKFGEKGKEVKDQIEELGFVGDFPPNHLTRFSSKALSIALGKSGFKHSAIGYSLVNLWDLFHYGLGDERFKFSSYSDDILKMNVISQVEERLNEMLSLLHLSNLGNSLIALASNEMDQVTLKNMLNQSKKKVQEVYTSTIRDQYAQYAVTDKSKDEKIAEMIRYIESLKEEIVKKDKNFIAMSENVELVMPEKDLYIGSLKEEIVKKDKNFVAMSENVTFALSEKDRYIESLKEEIAKMENQLKQCRKT